MGPPHEDWLGLAGSVCVVTAAGHPVAREIAVRLAAAGAALLLLDSDAVSCGETAAAAVNESVPVLALPCDLTDPDSLAAAAREAESLGVVDILVNATAMRGTGPLGTHALSDWEASLAGAIRATLLCAEEFGRPMLERGRGAMVHVCAAAQPQASAGPSDVARSAVASLSRQIAFEWGPRGVRSNVVSPGLVRAPLADTVRPAPLGGAQRDLPVPLRRWGAPADVADAVLFLASPRASYVTGQELVVDGGLAQTSTGYLAAPPGAARAPQPPGT